MHSGDILTDSRGAAWILDGALGRGLWGRTWALKGEDGTLAVLKAPLTAADLGRATDPEALAEVCAAVSEATRAAYEERAVPFLPRLLGTLSLPDGRTGLVLPRYDASLSARLAGGVALSDTLDLVVRCLHQLTTSRSAGTVHGNLRPSNIFSDGQGNPVLTDPALPVLQAHRRALEAAAPERASWIPPEAEGPPRGAWDTWALCLALWRACSAPTAAEDPSARRDALPDTGVGRVALATIKDAAAARLKAEGANKRFAARAVAKLGAVLNRGLSPEHEPSPPYRFERPAELLERLVEVDELLHPRIESVSKALLGPAARDGVFEGGDKVTFTVHVGATDGVTAHDDLAVGLQLLDVDAHGDARVRVDGSRFTVNRFPAGKWRYQFELPDVPPGRYRIKVAFLVKEETGEAQVAEGSFEVRPRPGWVPPPATSEVPTPIPLPSAQRARPVEPDADDEPLPPRPGPATPIRPGTPTLRAVEPDEADEGEASYAATPEPLRTASRPAPIAPPARPVSPAAVSAFGPPTSPGGPATSSGVRPTVMTAPPAPARPQPPGAVPAQRPIEPRPLAVPVALPPAPASFEPATSPSLPTVAHDTHVAPEGYVEGFLSDYPPPPPTGVDDLPSYDLGAHPTVGSSPWSGLVERVLGWFGGDPWSAGMALTAGGFVAVLLAMALLRSCGA